MCPNAVRASLLLVLPRGTCSGLSSLLCLACRCFGRSFPRVPVSQPIMPLARAALAASSCLSATPHRGARQQALRSNPYAHQASASASHSATTDARHTAHHSHLPSTCFTNHGCQTIPPSCRGLPLVRERLPTRKSPLKSFAPNRSSRSH